MRRVQYRYIAGKELGADQRRQPAVIWLKAAEFS